MEAPHHSDGPPEGAGPLRRGWTTGACAAAAAKAAFTALRQGDFPDPVSIRLPGGETPAFALARTEVGPGWAMAGIVKDAGDDPDVTHGALVLVTTRPLPAGTGLRFRAGPGVGTVTRPGLPLPPGEPAINPGPRRMIADALAEVAGGPVDAEVEIGIPGGKEIALRTLNGRLGIVGGLSVLGTTGIVIPYSCAAWIDSIHRGVDVARAMGLAHVAGATGSASEAAVQKLHGLPETALIEMGDFVGGMLKYLRRHPVPRVTIAGGVAKMTKLAQGMLDLHSKRGAADLDALAATALAAGADAALAARLREANTVAEAFAEAGAAGLPLGDLVAREAWRHAAAVLLPAATELEVVVFDRDGRLMGRAPFAPLHHAPLPR
ncbi:cobalt-precorrin-5B (C(1))-methyltransferase [Roseomonas harenae]|uniref:cobalt-precorrin-5B (C(1))-methyltransferase n=1 Tax=Muricoccus harenae TaxID=2692566 RepID=UPI0013316D5B|nr:cobalt-precorrin-5B (C(1))-methyltransferase [Roseomonas harenae]